MPTLTLDFFFDLIGYVSVLFVVLAAIAKTTKGVLYSNLVATGMLGTSLFFNGGISGAAANAVTFTSKLLALNIPEERLSLIKYSAPAIAFLVFLFSGEGLSGVLPSIALCFVLIADSQTNVFRMKLWYAGSLSCWLIYVIALADWTT